MAAKEVVLGLSWKRSGWLRCVTMALQFDERDKVHRRSQHALHEHVLTRDTLGEIGNVELGSTLNLVSLVCLSSSQVLFRSFADFESEPI